MSIVPLKLATITLLSTLIPTVVIGQTISLSPPNAVESAAPQTATPSIMLEKSQSYALDNYVRAFQVPTMDSNGNIHYYDVTITLGVDTNGKPNPVANVSASLSPVVTTGVIVPGTYKATDGATCKVINMTLTNGRIQSFFTCTRKDKVLFELSVATGPITAGHPYLNQLVTAGIDKHPDVGTYTWGFTTSGVLRVGTCGNFGMGWPVGAKTNGSQLILSMFNNYSPGLFFCSGTFTKQP